MSFDHFSKENIDTYLKELAKEFRHLNGKGVHAEIILVGGAAILTNYGFRDMTTDIDAAIYTSAAMKDVINHVGDKFDLPNGWLNADFTHTGSYSDKLREYSIPYKTFYGVIEVRSIAAEYLVAMKLRAARRYKNDLSDIIGILGEHERRGTPIDLEQIEKAVFDLYGGWDHFEDNARTFIQDALQNGNLVSLYASTREEELDSRDLLVSFEKTYPQAVTQKNINDVLQHLKNRRDKQT